MNSHIYTHTTGSISRPLGVRVIEQQNNIYKGITERSKIAKHVLKNQHGVKWDEVEIFGKDKNGFTADSRRHVSWLMKTISIKALISKSIKARLSKNMGSNHIFSKEKM